MKKHNKDKKIIVCVPVPLLDDFKDACGVNYKSISEAIRDMMQRYIKENKQ